MINKMTLSEYQDALRPKVQGTLNLHQKLSTTPLDFFILLSSCAGVIGNIGQANYASACTFQDAFARHRTGLGMPTRSLDLGMMAGAGYVSQNTDAFRFLAAQEFRPVTLPELFAMLDFAISRPVRSVDDSQLITGLTYPEQKFLPPNLMDARFADLRASRTHSATSKPTAGQQSLQASIQKADSLGEAQHLMTSAIISQVSKVLVVPAEDVDPSKSIVAYGGDSLTAVELRTWFSMTANASVGIMEILGSKSLETLAKETLVKGKRFLPKEDGRLAEESEEATQ